MWPHKFTVAGVEDGFDLVGGQDNLDYVTHCICREITRSIQFYVRLEFSADETFLPAQVLYNHFEDPLWGGLGAGYGIGQTRDAMQQTTAALKLLKKARHPKHQGKDSGAAYQKYAIGCLTSLPYPATVYVKDALKKPDQIEEFVKELHQLYAAYLPQLEKLGGNTRAKRTAIGLWVIFEMMKTPIKVGDYLGRPSGDFCKCLDEIFSITGIEAGAKYYAEHAKKAHLAEDEDYQYFRRAFTEVWKHHPIISIS